MNFGNQVALGVRSWFRAVGFIFSNGLWWTFIIPVLLNIGLFWIGMSSVGAGLDLLESFLDPYINIQDDSFWGAEYLSGWAPSLITGLLEVVLYIVFFFLFAMYGGYIVLMIMSPVLAYLSEKTEKIITGNDYPFDAEQLVRDAMRGVLIAMRNLVIETLWAIGCFIATLFFPALGVVTTPLMLGVSSYFYGFSFMDYYSERRRLTISQSVGFMRKNKWVAMSIGLGFAVFLIVPWCGISLAGFAAIVSTVSATLAMHELVDEGKGGDVPPPKRKMIDTDK